jgi:signal transduction histidine kinase
MASSGGTRAVARRVTRLLSGDRRMPSSPMLRRISLAAASAAFVLATVAVGTHVQGRSAPVTAAAALALLVIAGALAWIFYGPRLAEAQHLAALVVTGLGGGVLAGLFPATASFIIVCVALGGTGMLLALRPALVAGTLLLAAANLTGLLVLVTTYPGYLAHGHLSGPSLISQDLGAAFTFAVGAFTRSARISQATARGAQARAENLLAQLRASQAAQAEAAKLTERARLAREIHDILAHALSGLVLGLDTMELLARQSSSGHDGADPEGMARILEQVTRAQRIARDGLADTRRAIAALRGDELPGPALLDRLVADTAAATGIRAELTVTGEQRPLAPEIGLALYRTAQETLTNTAKYAGREGRAELRLRYTDDEVELAVEDARSADAGPPAGLTSGGYGLTGIRERAELLGGRLTAGPTDTGFKVLLRLPAAPAPALETAQAAR